MLKIDALIRYYSHFSLDPDQMDDDTFFKTWGKLYYALGVTGQLEK